MALLHAKTAAGRQEIEDRGRRLPAALRSILLMVDGHRDDTELRGLFEGLRAPPDALEQLAAQGLIEVIGGSAEVAPVHEDRTLHRCAGAGTPVPGTAGGGGQGAQPGAGPALVAGNPVGGGERWQ